MALKQYAVVMAFGVLIGMVVGGTVVAADVAPIESIDDAVGDEDELAGVGTPSDIDSGTDDGSSQDGDTTTTTDTEAATATATDTSDSSDAGGTDETDTPASTPTETAASGSTDTATSTAIGNDGPFSFVIQEITQCGDTCRDITAAVTNEQSTEASDVTTFTEIYAGNETSSDTKIYENEQSVGTIPTGETTTTTQRVEFSLTEAVQIRDNGGWVTIVTKITDADGETVTVTQRRDVT